MAIILSFFTGEQICEECAQHSGTPCTKCSPSTDDESVIPSSGCVFNDLGLERPADLDAQLDARRDRLLLDTVAE